MTARLAALLPRLTALTIIGLLAASSITFAAVGRRIEKTDAAAQPVQSGPKTLLVPDVRHQAYVFAKGILEDGGFAWRVVGPVRGYAANLVAVQNPAPGTRVLDTGAPTLELRLERNTDYTERGLPENSSPFPGTKLTVAGAKPVAAPKPEQPKQPQKPADDPAAENDDGAAQQKEVRSAAADPRKPAFTVFGAPAEPTDEMPLPDRARLLERRVTAAPKPTNELVSYWLYQHSWLVTGARFGWYDGAAALRILVRVDRSIEARWGFGAKSTAVAERALAEVERKAAE